MRVIQCSWPGGWACACWGCWRARSAGCPRTSCWPWAGPATISRGATPDSWREETRSIRSPAGQTVVKRGSKQNVQCNLILVKASIKSRYLFVEILQVLWKKKLITFFQGPTVHLLEKQCSQPKILSIV